MQDFPLFSYRIGNSFVHKIPALIKVFFLLLFPITIFLTPLYITCSLSLICIVVARCIGFTFKEQFRDILPIIAYCFFLFIVWITNVLFSDNKNSKDLFTLGFKLIASMQWTAIFFKTTTSIQLQNALECVLPKSVAQLFSLFLNFIPMLFSVWHKLNTSWKARGGKNGITKILTLLPIFISLSLHKAYNMNLTLENRS